MPKKKELTITLPVRMRLDERSQLKKAAKAAKKSESRFLVISALILSQFDSEERVREALEVGWQLVEMRTAAVMGLRRASNQLEQINEALASKAGSDNLEQLESALEEVSALLKGLRTRWAVQSAK